MKEIVIHNQKEWDSLPKSFDEFIYIYIKDTTEMVYVNMARDNSTVVARGNSTVVARGNSRVVAWGNSRVEARGNSTVVAWDNSRVVAWGNSRVVAWDNSRVEAWGNSTVVARGNSRVVAWGNSRVEAKGNVATYLQSTDAVVTLFMHAVCFVTSVGKVIKKSKTAKIIKPKSSRGLNRWLMSQGIKNKQKIIVYKRVSKDFKTQEGTRNEFLYKVGTHVEVKPWKPRNNECGEGKLHACSRPYFCDEFRSEDGDVYIAIQVDKKDLYAWPNASYPHKIAFRRGKVLYQCDRFGEKL